MQQFVQKEGDWNARPNALFATKQCGCSQPPVPAMAERALTASHLLQRRWLWQLEYVARPRDQAVLAQIAQHA